jgi:hypothetical protein
MFVDAMRRHAFSIVVDLRNTATFADYSTHKTKLGLLVIEQACHVAVVLFKYFEAALFAEASHDLPPVLRPKRCRWH